MPHDYWTSCGLQKGLQNIRRSPDGHLGLQRSVPVEGGEVQEEGAAYVFADRSFCCPGDGAKVVCYEVLEPVFGVYSVSAGRRRLSELCRGYGPKQITPLK